MQVIEKMLTRRNLLIAAPIAGAGTQLAITKAKSNTLEECHAAAAILAKAMTAHFGGDWHFLLNERTGTVHILQQPAKMA